MITRLSAMRIRGRGLRFTAVSVLVVLALTGFSTGRGRGGSHGGGGGGGRCSSSSQDHDSSRSSTSGGGSYGSGGSGGSYGSDDDDDHGTSGGGSYNRRPHYGSTPTSSSGSGKALRDGTAKLVTCATPASPHATVEVGNPNGRKATFSVSVTFEDARGITVVDRYADVTVPAQGKATVEVEVGAPGLVDSVDHCEVDRQALVDD
ncbi:hypothetical protein GCM10010255_49520 [Streptomyces coeruleofuscus]|uniref:Secreted protein n=2 Tax=Streptomyces coeruleofuscus TaxID=66879 RepID=A0ABN3IN53_9ACTN